MLTFVRAGTCVKKHRNLRIAMLALRRWTMKNYKSVSVQVIDSDIALLLPNGVYEIKQMELARSRLKSIAFICVFLAVSGIVGFGYFCSDKVHSMERLIAFIISFSSCCYPTSRSLERDSLVWNLRGILIAGKRVPHIQ